MPGLVTILCHAECFGAWTSFWGPCRGMWTFESKFQVEGDAKLPTESTYVLFECVLVSRSDICGWQWRHMNVKKCVEATIEHL
eukprot:2162172-Amphidinium_carterae.1